MKNYRLFLSSALILLSFAHSEAYAASCGFQASGDYNCGSPKTPGGAPPAAAPTTSTTTSTPSPFIPGGGPISTTPPGGGVPAIPVEPAVPLTPLEEAWRDSPQADAANARVEEALNSGAAQYDPNFYDRISGMTPEEIMRYTGTLVTVGLTGVIILGQVLRDDDGNVVMPDTVNAPYSFEVTLPATDGNPDADPPVPPQPERVVGDMPDLWTPVGSPAPSNTQAYSGQYSLGMTSATGTDTQALSLGEDFTAASVSVCTMMYIPSGQNIDGLEVASFARSEVDSGRPSTSVHLNEAGEIELKHYLHDEVDGIYTETASTSAPAVVPRDSWFQLCVGASGGSASVSIDGTEILNAPNTTGPTSFTYTGIQVGILNADAGVTMYMDDLQISHSP